MQDIIFSVLNYVAFAIGLIGILVITLGALSGFWAFIIRKTFWQVRVILVKHILLGLDFLIGRDIIETVVLKSDRALWIDLAALVLIIAIRVVFSLFAEKEMEQLIDEKRDGEILSIKSSENK
jgi:uncharacterized membrane protein